MEKTDVSNSNLGMEKNIEHYTICSSESIVNLSTERGKISLTSLAPNGHLPVMTSHGAAGYDLRVCERTLIANGQRMCVDTGVHVSMPNTVMALVMGRSSSFMDSGLMVIVGLVDPDYKHTIKVMMWNTSSEPTLIEAGTRVAQLVFLPRINFVAGEVSKSGGNMHGTVLVSNRGQMGSSNSKRKGQVLTTPPRD